MISNPRLIYRGIKIGVKRELDNIREHDIPWYRRFWLYRHGFISSRGVIYELSDTNVQDYINDIQAQRARLQYREWSDSEITDNKLLFHTLFGRTHPDRVPELIAVWDPDRGVVSPPAGRVTTFDELMSVAKDRRLIMKPKSGWGGQDVHVFGYDDSQLVFDGKPVSESELMERFKTQEKSIFTEYISQAEYADRIYSGASNTIRILVMVDPDTDEPFIAAVVHRFGTEESGNVDNWSSGGLSVEMDTETGELGRAAKSHKDEGGFVRVTHHPDTGGRIVGTVIPAWNEIREGVLEIARDYRSMLKYTGWDIIVTDDNGSFKIIEGNAVSDLDLLQTHGPLLTDDKVKKFYRHYGVL